MNSRKVLLFIGAGPEMVPGICWAKELGLKVVATDMNPLAEGFNHADDYFVASTRDVTATLKAAESCRQRHGLDGVMTLASDVPLTVASVAEKYSLPGLSTAVARVAQDKLQMKQMLQHAAIPIPVFASARNLTEAQAGAERVGFPLVVKPVDNSGARGVTLVEDRSALATAVDWALQHRFADTPLLLEEFLPGPQISTETLVVGGEFYTVGFADRNYELNAAFKPHFIEDGHTIPSELSERDQRVVSEVAERAIAALGIDFGIGKGDLVLTPEGPKVIEIAARLSGGRFSTDTVPLATGVNLVKAMICLAVGEPVNPSSLQPQWQRGAAQRYLFPAAGKVIKITGLEKARAPDWIRRVEIYVKAGDIIEPVTNHAQRSGYVIAEGVDRAEAVEHALWARDQITIDTVPA